MDKYDKRSISERIVLPNLEESLTFANRMLARSQTQDKTELLCKRIASLKQEIEDVKKWMEEYR